MRIKLIRKFSDVTNGVDLANVRTGDVLDVKAGDAYMLIAEGWAEPITSVRVSQFASKQKIEPAESGA